MEILSKSADNLKRCYNVLLSQKDIEDAELEKLKQKATKIRMNGFRPGKVPLDIAKREYGSSIRGEVEDELVMKTSAEIIYNEKLQISFRYYTSIEKRDENGIEFSLKFELLPELTVPDLSEVEIVRYVADVADKEADAVLDDLRKTYKKWEIEPAGTEVAEGHKVVVDLMMKTKSKNPKENSVKDLELIIGGAEIHETVWSPFVGCKVGDERSFSLKYPTNAKTKAPATKLIEYSGVVKKILRSEERSYDDAFAVDMGFDNLEAMREWALNKATAQYKMMAKDVMRRKLLEEIAARSDFLIPENMLAIEKQEVERQVKELAESLGKEMTPEICDQCTKIASDRIRLGFVISEIAKQHNIVVSMQEITAKIKNIAAMYPGQEKRVYEIYSRNDMKGAIAGPILESKVVEYLFGVVKIIEEACSTDALYEIDQEEFEFFTDKLKIAATETLAASEHQGQEDQAIAALEDAEQTAEAQAEKTSEGSE